jgi:hypothetical protein
VPGLLGEADGMVVLEAPDAQTAAAAAVELTSASTGAGRYMPQSPLRRPSSQVGRSQPPDVMCVRVLAPDGSSVT